jgi:hypothetical protein
MSRRICKLIFLAILLVSVSLSICAQSQGASSADKRTNPIFIFHTDEFWLNLHHFLYVLGRAENKERDTARTAVAAAPADQDRGLKTLNEKEQKIWREAVAAYAAGVSKKDLVFDAPLPAVTGALARAGESKTLTSPEMDRDLVAVLERAAPIYRKAWWKQHRDANRNWQKSIESLINQHGVAVLAFITRAYKMEWPTSGFPVHVSGYSNWAGAYSTDGNLLVMSSQSPDLHGLYGFETAFHEAMHQWDAQMFDALRQQAIKLNKFFPRGLSHSMIFFTAGQAVLSVVPGHVPYADKFGVWQRGMAQFKAPLEEVWKPYLDGRGTRDEAFAALLLRTAVEPKQ